MSCEVLVLDCDGVLLDSNGMKSRLFERVLSDYPDAAVAPFLSFQKRSFGMSRGRLFDAFFKEFLSRAPHSGELETLLDRFGRLCSRAYTEAEETLGASKALPRLAERYRLFIASGGLESELKTEVERRGWSPLFEGVFGAPRLKEDILACLAKEFGSDSMLFVGDSAVDARCALAVGIPFLFMSPYSASPKDIEQMMVKHEISQIRTLDELCRLSHA